MFRCVLERMNRGAVIRGGAVATGIVVNLLFESAHVSLFGGEALDAATPPPG